MLSTLILTLNSVRLNFQSSELTIKKTILKNICNKFHQLSSSTVFQDMKQKLFRNSIEYLPTPKFDRLKRVEFLHNIISTFIVLKTNFL